MSLFTISILASAMYYYLQPPSPRFVRFETRSSPTEIFVKETPPFQVDFALGTFFYYRLILNIVHETYHHETSY